MNASCVAAFALGFAAPHLRIGRWVAAQVCFGLCLSAPAPIDLVGWHLCFVMFCDGQDKVLVLVHKNYQIMIALVLKA